MARKRSSGLEDLITLLARLPWWVSALIGVISWLVLRQIAANPPAPANALNTADMSGLMLRTLAYTFANIGQYLLPAICAIGAIGSLVTRSKRKKLLQRVNTASQPARTIDGLSWRQFEQVIGEAFRTQGYSVSETGSQGADGGIDLTLHKDGEKYLVQCKHWRAQKVGVPVVRDFLGAMAAEGAVGGMVITSGQFTSEAKAFAEGRNIQLIDGSKLKTLLAKHNPTTEPEQPTSTTPFCPLCQSAMVKRTARRGPNAGNAFWGCSKYPGCKGAVNAASTPVGEPANDRLESQSDSGLQKARNGVNT
ncbi:restriction endonuclease [Halopseudomonas salegens]|uniref:Restriction system protein n=1 Tax=Halopseudomonas salegens TaxID=1434072 RepID=A0A1H2HY67_9GAMM|nr:restriction endonuclease [Halopseudomonas salegens]SDU36862.1 restriction system protein [Halopseudomonas salegens]